MIVHLAYGQTGLDISLPNEWQVSLVEPRFYSALAQPEQVIQAALRGPIGSAPLAELVPTGSQVGIIVNDITRACPSRILLKTILKELAHIPPDKIVLFIALGTHRSNSPEELCQMLGTDLVEQYRIIQNNAFDPTTQLFLGMTQRGHPVWINRSLVECDFRILTGFIEPHFFAGFSGGGKAIMPGMGGAKTILANHSPEMIAHSRSTWGITTGNPIWEEITEISHQVGASFLVNVTMNRNKEITGVFAGNLDKAHAAGCEFACQASMVPVPELFDLVLTTNSGYPLDQNLYQSVKGISAAAQIVRPGGAIIIATECRDGIPNHGQYGQLLRSASNPTMLLEQISQPGFQMHDSWQVQIQAQIQQKADVYVFSDKLSDDQIRSALFQPAYPLEATLQRLMLKFGQEARICVLPEGPQTIPYLSLSSLLHLTGIHAG